MIATIERTDAARYGARMRIAAIHLLALVAMLMMPFGMAAAPAAPAAGHHGIESMAGEHCPDGESENGLGGASAGCAMPCSSALPAAHLAPVGLKPVAARAAAAAPQSRLAGILLEIATPPPKFA